MTRPPTSVRSFEMEMLELLTTASFQVVSTTTRGRAGTHRSHVPTGGGTRLLRRDMRLSCDGSCLAWPLLVQAAHGQVDGRSRHPARPIRSHEDRNVRHLVQRHEPSGMGPVGDHLLPLFPGRARESVVLASKTSFSEPASAMP